MKYNPDIVARYFEQCGIENTIFEHRFHPVRRWRFDLAWIDSKVALEVQGGIFSQGRHTRGAALLKEWEKLNTAAEMGWRILYCQPKDLCMMQTIETIKRAIGTGNNKGE